MVLFSYVLMPVTFKPEITIVIFIHYKPRIAVANIALDKNDLMWFKN